MSSVNKVSLIGNLGKDPEVKTVGSDKVANFSLATNESYKDKDGNKVDKTEWHNIVMWRKLAELAEKYLTKGSQIYLEGKLKTRSWDDKDGNKKYMTEVQAYEMKFLAKSGNTQPETAPQAPEQSTPVDEDESGLPF